MAEETTKGMGGDIKVPKVTQQYINAIERRLVLSGGTTLTEIGNDLANRYGKAEKVRQGLRNARAYKDIEIEAAIEKTGMERQTAKRRRIAEIRTEMKKADADRATEVAGFRLMAEKYVISEYGEERRNGNKDLIGYGDRIEMVRKGHLKKIW